MDTCWIPCRIWGFIDDLKINNTMYYFTILLVLGTVSSPLLTRGDNITESQTTTGVSSENQTITTMNPPVSSPLLTRGDNITESQNTTTGLSSENQTITTMNPPVSSPLLTRGDDVTEGQNTGPSSEKQTVITTIPPVQTTTGGQTLPGITLFNGSQICFRAVFTCNPILIKYQAKNLPTTKFLTASVTPPDKYDVDGRCGPDTTTVKLSWAEGNYTLSMVFKQTMVKGQLGPVVVSTWAATDIDFTFDTTDNPIFHHIASRGIYATQTAKDDVHFSAPSNFSYTCSTTEDISLFVMNNGTKDNSVIESTTISLYDVKVQAFEVQKAGMFSESAACKPDVEKHIPHENIIPLVVAACLAGVIAIIIVAYFFIKNRSSTQYSSME